MSLDFAWIDKNSSNIYCIKRQLEVSLEKKNVKSRIAAYDEYYKRMCPGYQRGEILMRTKNHSFSDGNKRIAATMFLYFLDKNGILFADGNKLIDDHTLVALTIMIAESKPDEKEMMISVIMNCICG